LRVEAPDESQVSSLQPLVSHGGPAAPLSSGEYATSHWRVPLAKLELSQADVQAVVRCLGDGALAMGPLTRELERALASFLGVRHAVLVANGTAALHLACLAADVSAGDEVIVPSLSFVASASAVRYVGATPVLCDVRSAQRPLLDPDRVAELIGPRTRAVMPVHLWGYPADTAELGELCKERGLALIEDAAQGIGAKVDDHGAQAGTQGVAGTFSFFSKKQLSLGEGGAVATNDASVAGRVHDLRSQRRLPRTGFSFRLDEPRAALGLSRLPRLARDIEGRRGVARAYRERLEGVAGLELTFDEAAVERGSHFAFAVLVDAARRDAVRKAMADKGVQTTVYPTIHTLSAYRGLPDGRPLRHATEAAARHICLPMSASLREDEIELVCEALASALAR
jgi:dTDP-4-amino-4,6-dideoxygalactose transaminase